VRPWPRLDDVHIQLALRGCGPRSPGRMISGSDLGRSDEVGRSAMTLNIGGRARVVSRT